MASKNELFIIFGRTLILSFHFSKSVRQLPLSGSDHIPLNEANALAEDDSTYIDAEDDEQKSCKYFIIPSILKQYTGLVGSSDLNFALITGYALKTFLDKRPFQRGLGRSATFLEDGG